MVTSYFSNIYCGGSARRRDNKQTQKTVGLTEKVYKCLRWKHNKAQRIMLQDSSSGSSSDGENHRSNVKKLAKTNFFSHKQTSLAIPKAAQPLQHLSVASNVIVSKRTPHASIVQRFANQRNQAPQLQLDRFCRDSSAVNNSKSRRPASTSINSSAIQERRSLFEPDPSQPRISLFKKLDDGPSSHAASKNAVSNQCIFIEDERHDVPHKHQLRPQLRQLPQAKNFEQRSELIYVREDDSLVPQVASWDTHATQEPQQEAAAEESRPTDDLNKLNCLLNQPQPQVLNKLKLSSTADDTTRAIKNLDAKDLKMHAKITNSNKFYLSPKRRNRYQACFYEALDTCSETEGDLTHTANTPAVQHSDTVEPLDLSSQVRQLELSSTKSDYLNLSDLSSGLSSKQKTLSPKALLNETYQALIKEADPNRPLVSNPLYKVSNESMKRLKPGVWLNDELINAYVYLVNQRLAKAPQGSASPRMMCLNTYFMAQLESEIEKKTYSASKLEKRVQRQIKQFNTLGATHKIHSLADLDVILIPVNQCQSHWLLIALDLKVRRAYIVNSMTTGKQRALHYGRVLSRFINDLLPVGIDTTQSNLSEEAVQSGEKPMPTTIVENVPKQPNSNDCGLCVCLNMVRIADSGASCILSTPFGYSFTQGNDSETFSRMARKLVSLQIVQGRISNEILAQHLCQ